MYILHCGLMWVGWCLIAVLACMGFPSKAYDFPAPIFSKNTSTVTLGGIHISRLALTDMVVEVAINFPAGILMGGYASGTSKFAKLSAYNHQQTQRLWTIDIGGGESGGVTNIDYVYDGPADWLESFHNGALHLTSDQLELFHNGALHRSGLYVAGWSSIPRAASTAISGFVTAIDPYNPKGTRLWTQLIAASVETTDAYPTMTRVLIKGMKSYRVLSTGTIDAFILITGEVVGSLVRNPPATCMWGNMFVGKLNLFNGQPLWYAQFPCESPSMEFMTGVDVIRNDTIAVAVGELVDLHDFRRLVFYTVDIQTGDYGKLHDPFRDVQHPKSLIPVSLMLHPFTGHLIVLRNVKDPDILEFQLLSKRELVLVGITDLKQRVDDQRNDEQNNQLLISTWMIAIPMLMFMLRFCLVPQCHDHSH